MYKGFGIRLSLVDNVYVWYYCKIWNSVSGEVKGLTFSANTPISVLPDQE